MGDRVRCERAAIVRHGFASLCATAFFQRRLIGQVRAELMRPDCARRCLWL